MKKPLDNITALHNIFIKIFISIFYHKYSLKGRFSLKDGDGLLFQTNSYSIASSLSPMHDGHNAFRNDGQRIFMFIAAKELLIKGYRYVHVTSLST